MRELRKWTDEEVTRLRRLWATKLGDKEIAARLARTRGCMRRKAEQIGLRPRRLIWAEQERMEAQH